MATAAAIALGLTSAVGLYGASAEEKRVLGPYDTGSQAQLNLERAKTQAAEARVAKLERDLQEERKRREGSEARCCNSPAAEEAFRQAPAQVLEVAADGLIQELGIVNEKLKTILQSPAKSILSRGTILQLYELAVLAESSIQRGGAEEEPSTTVYPPPAPASSSESMYPDLGPKPVSSSTTDMDPVPLEPPSSAIPVEVPVVSAPSAIPIEVPAVSAPSAMSITEMGCLAFAALWLKHINLAIGGVKQRQEQKQTDDAKARSDDEARRLSQAFHMSLDKAVKSVQESRKSIDEMFDKLPEDRKTLVQSARDELDKVLSEAKRLLEATELGTILDVATWVSKVESSHPDWKSTKDRLQRRLTDYETATKGAASTKEKIPLSVRLFGSKTPPPRLRSPMPGTPAPSELPLPEFPEPEPINPPMVSPFPISVGGPVSTAEPVRRSRQPTATETRRNNLRKYWALTPQQRAKVNERMKTRRRGFRPPSRPAAAPVPAPSSFVPAPPPAPSSAFDAAAEFRRRAEQDRRAQVEAELEKELGEVITPQERAALEAQAAAAKTEEDRATAEALKTAEELPTRPERTLGENVTNQELSDILAGIDSSSGVAPPPSPAAASAYDSAVGLLSPSPASPPGPPPPRAFRRGNLRPTPPSSPSPSSATPYSEVLQNARRSLKPTGKGRMRKRTLKKRRGVNKRNV